MNIENEVRKRLFELSDKKYQEFHSNLCPNNNNILGVRVPILRNYAKELLNKYDINELLENIKDDYYEEIMLQGMIIGLDKSKDINITLSYIDNFVPKIDNWAICDVFCAGLKITNRYKEEMWKYICKYLKSDKEFELRFAIVMMLDYYIDEEHMHKILAICDNIHSDKYYVQMAVAWLLSICLIKYYDETIGYLNSCELDKFTYNKAIQKAIESYRLDKNQKEELKKMKK